MRLHQQGEQVTGHPKSSDKQGTGPNVETQNTVVGCYVREHASSGGQRTQVLERSSAAVGLALMIESIMFFSGGFLVASLLGLALISVVHQRAVRLTERTWGVAAAAPGRCGRANNAFGRAYFEASLQTRPETAMLCSGCSCRITLIIFGSEPIDL
jgi:hypothetical protein